MNSSNKVCYYDFWKEQKTIPIYSSPWWLDAVCGETNWDVILYYDGNEPIASMPYFKTRRLSVKVIKMPTLTQALGAYIRYPENLNVSDKMSLEKKVYNFFISNLPKAGAQFHNFHYSSTNWLPFYWAGYKQTTRYTYIIEDITDLKKVFENFSNAKKKNIRKAEKSVEVKFDLSSEEFFDHHKYTLKKQGSKIVYSFATFKRLFDGAYKNGAGRTIYAIDENNNIHSALFCVWDNASGYDLISTIDSEYRNSGSATLLVWEMIKFLSNRVPKFDFEGSMDESVERSFRQFGAVQYPYSRIYRIDSPILKVAYSFI